MPGYLLSQNSIVRCLHGGEAKLIAPYLRVKVSGQPIALQPIPYLVSGCLLPRIGRDPCLLAQWLTGSLRIRASGLPILLSITQAMCVPTRTGVQIISTQTRVKGV